jgi:hypothetical protein
MQRTTQLSCKDAMVILISLLLAMGTADVYVYTADLCTTTLLLLLLHVVHFQRTCMQGAMGLATYRILVLPAPPNQGPHFDAAAEPAARIDTGYLQGTLVAGVLKHSDIFDIGPFSSAVECERKLRQRGLVHAVQGEEGAEAALLLQLELKDVQ